MTNKQSLIFTCSIVATTFSLLGWLCISFLSPNKCIYVISIPIIIFIAKCYKSKRVVQILCAL